MSKLISLHEAIKAHAPDGSSVAIGLQLEQMIPFSAGHEIIRQQKKNLTLIGPISDILFDQLIGAGCVEKVIAAWVGNVMMGQAYNFRRAVEQEKIKVFNLTNFTIALALQAGAMGVPYLPTRSAQGSDVPKNNHFFYQVFSPFEGKEPLLAVRALNAINDLFAVRLALATLFEERTVKRIAAEVERELSHTLEHASAADLVAELGALSDEEALALLRAEGATIT